ncbi:MAG: hypothetical protein J0L78_11905 [Planctomycetes bacterium]|nr:hypothetical protein [Planctomycetota bacterium]
MANNPNQNNGNQQNPKNQQSAGREVSPSRPAGEPGKLPQNAGSALDSGKAGTATQQQQSKSQSAQSGQSKFAKDEIGQKHSAGTPTKGSNSRAARDDDQDVDAPTGIGQAVRKGEAESALDGGEDDLGHQDQKGKGDCCGGSNKPM